MDGLRRRGPDPARHGATEDWQAEAGAAQPFGRLIDPEEVARAVVFLASSDSGLMTGSVIHYDQSVWGGYSFAPPTPERAMSLDGALPA
nr:SDR family oxidoreductase [Thalassococcus profundi]